MQLFYTSYQYQKELRVVVQTKQLEWLITREPCIGNTYDA